MTSLCGSIQIPLARSQATGRLSSSSVSRNIVKTISSRNPWISSIAGKYIWNNNVATIPCYFLSPNDEEYINIAAGLLGLTTLTVFEWSDVGRNAAIECCEQISNFINKESFESNYEESRIVFKSFNDDELGFYGVCAGPELIYAVPDLLQGKAWVFINSGLLGEDVSFGKGSPTYTLLLHEIGHAFGLSHPHDDGGESTVMPGVNTNIIPGTGGLGVYEQNHIFNTVMSYEWNGSFLPTERNWSEAQVGYPETIMPLDYAALRFLYKIPQTFSSSFITKWGFNTLESNKTKCFIGNMSLYITENSPSIIYLHMPSVDVTKRGLRTGKTLNRIIGQYGVMPVEQLSPIRRIFYSNPRTNFLMIQSLEYSSHVFLDGSATLNIFVGFVHQLSRLSNRTILLDVRTNHTLIVTNRGSGRVIVSKN